MPAMMTGKMVLLGTFAVALIKAANGRKGCVYLIVPGFS